jgi:hypothetical protein
MRFLNWLFWWRSASVPAGPTHPAPAPRIFAAAFENRSFGVAARANVFAVPHESRIFVVTI